MRILTFEGMAPQVDPSRLAEGLSERAVNAGFQRGALTALPVNFTSTNYSKLKGNRTGSLKTAESMFYSHMADAWFAFTDQVRRGIDSLIAPQDEWRRIYFADSTGPRYTIGDNYSDNSVNITPTSYRLGVPAPDGAPLARLASESIPEGLEEEDLNRQQVIYVFTLVDDLGQEGPPSIASGGVEVPIEFDFSVTVDLPLGNSDTGQRRFTGAARKRVYRSTSGTSGTYFQYVGEVAYTQASFTDTVPYGEEAEVLPTDTWHPAPDEIKEIDAVGSNFLAGFYGNMLCYSEVKLPHAWPYEYRFPLKTQITAIQSTANGLFVGTTGKPYWCYGADPQAAVPQEMDYDYPCLSRDSVVDVGGFVVYASHDGLVAVDGQQAQLLTGGIFTSQDWKELDPATLKAFAFEGRYLFYVPLTDTLYAITPSDPRSLTLVSSGSAELFSKMTCAARDSRHDRTILVADGFGIPNLTEVQSTAAGNVSWTSRIVRDRPRSFGLGQVMASEYPVTLTIRGDDRELTLTVQSEDPFRLPAWGRKRDWQLTLEMNSGGDSRRAIYSAVLAGSTKELVYGA